MATEKVFADGFVYKQPREQAPDWVLGSISVKVEDAIAFLQNNQKNGWVNLNIHNSKAGKPYIELDTFVPKANNNASAQASAQAAAPGIDF